MSVAREGPSGYTGGSLARVLRQPFFSASSFRSKMVAGRRRRCRARQAGPSTTMPG
jgi:hypothetical protein